MSAEEHQPALEQDFLAHADVAEALRGYHRQQLLVHMIGPIISLLLHVVILSLMSVLVVRGESDAPDEFEVKITEIEIKELKEPEIEQIEEAAEDMTADVPAVETPEAPASDVEESNVADAVEEMPGVEDGADEMEDLPEVLVNTSPLTLPGILEGRTKKGRDNAVRKYGGGQKGQAAVRKALRWLKKQQRPDGSWRSHPAHTGLALLTFLAHGETPLSEEYGETVQKGMEWLAELMIARRDLGYQGYGHGIATYALAEAYGMTKIPKLRRAMETGLQTIIDGQHDVGGFNYVFAREGRWDLSVSGWQFQAMKAGMVAGATNPGLSTAMRRGIRFCRRTAFKDGRFGYRSDAKDEYGNMVGIGVVSLQLMGEPNCREVKVGCETILKERLEHYEQVKKKPDLFEEFAGKYLYGWYYDTQAMFNRGDKYWRKWRGTFETVLIRAQKIEGYWPELGDKAPDPILATTWSCLQLEVFYRYLPTFDLKKMLAGRRPGRNASGSVSARAAGDDDDDDDDDDVGLIIE